MKCSCGNPFIRRQVLTACISLTEEIQKQREKQMEEYVQRCMEPRKRFIFFGETVTRTRDEALTYIKADAGSCWAYDNQKYLRRDEFQTAKDILAVAHGLQEPFINLTTKEFCTISKHYKA